MLILDKWEKMVPLRAGVERVVRAATPSARRFVFDSDACAHVGNLLFQAGDLVTENIVFAKPPYEHTYIEIADMQRMFKSWRPTSINNPDTCDDKLGLLYVGERLYTFCSANSPKAEQTNPTIGMFSINRAHGQTVPLRDVFGETSDHPLTALQRLRIAGDHHQWREIAKLSYLLGGMRQSDHVMIVRADYDYFLNNFDLACTFDVPYGRDYSRVLLNAAFQGGGDLLIGAACLLLLHGNKRGVHVQQVPHRRGFFKSKPAVYRAHGVVTIKLGPHDTIRRIVFGARESPRVHDVMGTWVHYHHDRRCEHDWQKIEMVDDRERYQCTRCPTLRTWRKEHVRGDATKGIKTKTYSVTE
jgi:hypothetical protein